MGSGILLGTGGTFGTGPALGVWQRIPKSLIEDLPGKGHGFFTHFTEKLSGTTDGAYVGGWLYNEYTAGDLLSGGLEGGVVKLNGPDNTHGCQIQSDAAFVMDTDCQLAWGCRYKMVDADAQNVVMGLAINDTLLCDHIASTTADAIVVRHTADATLFYQVNTGAGGMTAATLGVTDVADDAWHTVDVFADKETAVEFWVDGTKALTYTTTTNFPTDTALALSFANEGTASANNYLYLDWAYAYQWRKDI